MYCYSCGEQLFYDKAALNKPSHCPKCKKEVSTLPPRMRIGDQIMMLNHDTILFANQVDGKNLMDYETPYLKVEIHPRHPEIWGIKNLSEDGWRYLGKEGDFKEVFRDGVIPIKDGLEVYLGDQVGHLRVGTVMNRKSAKANE